MKLELLLPHQLRQALRDRTPLVIPAGTIEYHGEHLGLGTDTLVVQRALERLEREIPLIIAPAFYYGPASYSVAGPEDGTLDVNVDRFQAHLRDVLRGFLATGFRNLHVIIHHQYEQGIELPEALAFKQAAATLIFEFMEAEHGRGWWGREDNADFYDTLAEDDNPWNWIQVHPLMHPRVQAQTGYDHAGLHETSLLMALCPEATDLACLEPGQHWYTDSAVGASREYGEKMVVLILEQLREELSGGTEPR